MPHPGAVILIDRHVRAWASRVEHVHVAHAHMDLHIVREGAWRNLIGPF